jgi:hypothetical protein
MLVEGSKEARTGRLWRVWIDESLRSTAIVLFLCLRGKKIPII